MPSGGTCKELTEQLSESCREEDTGSERMNWGADLGSCVSMLKLPFSAPLAKLRSSGTLGASAGHWDWIKKKQKWLLLAELVLLGPRTMVCICAPKNWKIESCREMGDAAAASRGKGCSSLVTDHRHLIL